MRRRQQLEQNKGKDDEKQVGHEWEQLLLLLLLLLVAVEFWVTVFVVVVGSLAVAVVVDF